MHSPREINRPAAGFITRGPRALTPSALARALGSGSRACSASCSPQSLQSNWGGFEEEALTLAQLLLVLLALLFSREQSWGVGVGSEEGSGSASSNLKGLLFSQPLYSSQGSVEVVKRGY